jgi:hypothetical protein
VERELESYLVKLRGRFMQRDVVNAIGALRANIQISRRMEDEEYLFIGFGFSDYPVIVSVRLNPDDIPSEIHIKLTRELRDAVFVLWEIGTQVKMAMEASPFPLNLAGLLNEQLEREFGVQLNGWDGDCIVLSRGPVEPIC